VNAPVQIIGFSSTDFVPGFVAEVIFGAGGVSGASVTLKLLLVGNKTTAGSKTANSDTDQAFSQTEADAFWGAGSELARMFRAAVRVPGVVIYGSPVTESGGVAATLTITIGSNAASDGTIVIYIDGEPVSVSIANGRTPTLAGDDVVLQVNAKTYLPVTAANVTGTVTLTRKQKGPRGNDAIVYIDQTKKPTTQTYTLGGAGAAVNTVGRKFGSGTTADDVTTVSANLAAAWYQRVALAHNDATNLGVWETATDAKAGPLVGKPEHVVVGFNGALASAQSLSQTTMNNARLQLLWMLNSESHPCEMAAVFAAWRTVTEQGDPDAEYDGKVLTGIAPARFTADIPQRSTQVAALQTGVTPVETINSEAKIVRSITTKCLLGANADYSTLDTCQSVVPDAFRIDLGLQWTTVYKVNNPNVADDPAPEQPERPSGTATPRRWNDFVIARLRAWEKGDSDVISSGRAQIIDVGLNLPISGYDKTAKRIMTLCPIVPAPKNHQVGVSIQQL
jgi:phage tail sheath gpL-like